MSKENKNTDTNVEQAQEMDFDMMVIELQNSLVTTLNDSPVPLTVKALILREVLGAVNQSLADKTVRGGE